MFLVIKCQRIPNGSKSKAIDNKYNSRHSISSHRVHPGAVVPIVTHSLKIHIYTVYIWVTAFYLSEMCEAGYALINKIWQFFVMLSCCLTWISACCLEMHIPPPYSVLLFTKKKIWKYSYWPIAVWTNNSTTGTREGLKKQMYIICMCIDVKIVPYVLQEK